MGAKGLVLNHFSIAWKQISGSRFALGALQMSHFPSPSTMVSSSTLISLRMSLFTAGKLDQMAFKRPF